MVKGCEVRKRHSPGNCGESELHSELAPWRCCTVYGNFSVDVLQDHWSLLFIKELSLSNPFYAHHFSYSSQQSLGVQNLWVSFCSWEERHVLRDLPWSKSPGLLGCGILLFFLSAVVHSSISFWMSSLLCWTFSPLCFGDGEMAKEGPAMCSSVTIQPCISS